jgi:hypothetical protein
MEYSSVGSHGVQFVDYPIKMHSKPCCFSRVMLGKGLFAFGNKPIATRNIG